VRVLLHGYHVGQVVHVGAVKCLVVSQLQDEVVVVPFTRCRWCTLHLGAWFDRTGWKWCAVPGVLLLLWLVRQCWLMQEALL
jgi:hypothetical protein